MKDFLVMENGERMALSILAVVTVAAEAAAAAAEAVVVAAAVVGRHSSVSVFAVATRIHLGLLGVVTNDE